MLNKWGPKLEQLLMEDNPKLTGSIAAYMTCCPALKLLRLSSTAVTGNLNSVPVWNSLEIFYIANTQITGDSLAYFETFTSIRR